MDWISELFAKYWHALFILAGLAALVWGWLDMKELLGIGIFLSLVLLGILFFIYYDAYLVIQYCPVLFVLLGSIWLSYSIWDKQTSLLDGLLALLALVGQAFYS